jgi:hypothetical protein
MQTAASRPKQLFRQPGGFEGLRLSVVAPHLNDPAVSHPEDVVDPLIDRDAAPSAPASNSHRRDYVVPADLNVSG